MHRLYSQATQQFPTLEKIADALGVELPARDEMKDIEPSSRLYRKAGATYMTAVLGWKAETEAPELSDVSFVLARNRRVTIRYSEPMPFRAFQIHADCEGGVLPGGAAAVVTLLDAIVDRNAEILEQTALQVDSISREVFAEDEGSRAGRGLLRKHHHQCGRDEERHHCDVDRPQGVGGLGALFFACQVVVGGRLRIERGRIGRYAREGAGLLDIGFRDGGLGFHGGSSRV